MNDWPFNQNWKESITFPGHLHTIEINADSYNAWVRNVCPLADQSDLADTAFEKGSQKEELFAAERNKSIVNFAKKVSAQGFISKPPPVRGLIDLGDGWNFVIRTLPYYHWGSVGFLQFGLKRTRLAIYEHEWDCYKKGAVMFTGPVHIPVLRRGLRPWMSLTPMEIYTLREALGYAQGNVLVAGLGMGWLTRKILMLPEVTSVTQIDLEPKILEVFGQPLKEEFGERLHLIQGDVWDYLEDAPEFDSYIFDIWADFGEAFDDDNFQLLKEDKNHVWGWGDDELCDDDEPEYEDHPDREFENDQISWYHDDPREWWGID